MPCDALTVKGGRSRADDWGRFAFGSFATSKPKEVFHAILPHMEGKRSGRGDAPAAGAVQPVQSAVERNAICRAVLEALPAWFGIAASRESYVAEVADLPLLVYRKAGQTLGFATLRRNTDAASELHLIAVLESAHRRGIGTALLAGIEAMARADGARFLTVKTLAPTHPDPGYAATRAFYAARGFLPVEVFPALWGTENPCLLMAKVLE